MLGMEATPRHPVCLTFTSLSKSCLIGLESSKWSGICHYKESLRSPFSVVSSLVVSLITVHYLSLNRMCSRETSDNNIGLGELYGDQITTLIFILIFVPQEMGLHPKTMLLIITSFLYPWALAGVSEILVLIFGYPLPPRFVSLGWGALIFSTGKSQIGGTRISHPSYPCLSVGEMA